MPQPSTHIQGWAKEMELSWEKVSARLQPATAGHASLVLSKTVPFFCTSLYKVVSLFIGAGGFWGPPKSKMCLQKLRDLWIIWKRDYWGGRGHRCGWLTDWLTEVNILYVCTMQVVDKSLVLIQGWWKSSASHMSTEAPSRPSSSYSISLINRKTGSGVNREVA